MCGAISDDSRKILLNYAMTTNQNVELKQLILTYYELDERPRNIIKMDFFSI